MSQCQHIWISDEKIINYIVSKYAWDSTSQQAPLIQTNTVRIYVSNQLLPCFCYSRNGPTGRRAHRRFAVSHVVRRVCEVRSGPRFRYGIIHRPTTQAQPSPVAAVNHQSLPLFLGAPLIIPVLLVCHGFRKKAQAQRLVERLWQQTSISISISVSILNYIRQHRPHQSSSDSSLESKFYRDN